jgi:hypothetical protein
LIVAVVGSVDQEKTADSLLGTAHYRAAPLPTHGIHQTNDPTTPAHIGTYGWPFDRKSSAYMNRSSYIVAV